MEQMYRSTLDTWPGREIEVGQMFVTVVVRAANVVKDFRENLRNLVGGRMAHYEALIQKAIEEALEETEVKAKQAGYDGILGVKVAHPSVVEGGVEILVVANGFCFRD